MGSISHHYNIKNVEETYLGLYVQQSILQPDVLSFLAKKHYRKSVYMGMGVNIGFDAVIICERKQEISGKFNATAPELATWIPVDLAARIHAKS